MKFILISEMEENEVQRLNQRFISITAIFKAVMSLYSFVKTALR